MSVEYRKAETTYHETGLGQADRVEVEHQIGTTIDGVFVPFASMSDNRAQSFVAAGKAAAEAEKAEKAAKS